MNNVKRKGKRWIALLLTFAMLLTMLPAASLPASAAGSETASVDIDLSTVSADGSGYTYKDVDGNKIITITEGGAYTLSQSGGGTVTANVIVEPTDDSNVKLTLNGVNIQAGSYTQPSRFRDNMDAGTAAISVQGNTTCKLMLAEGTENTLRGYQGRGNTLLRTAAISVENTYHNGVARLATLEIDGTGTLNAYGVEQTAAIGGNCNRLTGNITIKGGTINATGGYWGAAIGDGDTMGNVDIAKWNCTGAIVNGIEPNCLPATIAITGGTVKAVAQAGTPAIGSSDQLSGNSGAAGNAEWDGLRINISGGTIVAIGSVTHRWAATSSTAIGAGSGTKLNPANIVINKSEDLTLLAISRLSSKNAEGTYPISNSSADIPAISSESTATVLNILMNKTEAVPASTIDLPTLTKKLLTEEEKKDSKVKQAIQTLDNLLKTTAKDYNVCGVAVVLPIGKGGSIVVQPDGTIYYPPQISKPENVTLMEREADAVFSATVSKDPRDNSNNTPAYAFQWQISTDGGLNWNNLVLGEDYTVSQSTSGKGTTSTLTLKKDKVLLSKDDTQYRCEVTATVGQNVQHATSGAATLVVYNYHKATVNIRVGDSPVSLEEITGNANGKLYIQPKSGGDYQELKPVDGSVGSYSTTVLNGEYPVFYSEDGKNFEPFHDLKFIISDGDVERVAQFYSVTYNWNYDNKTETTYHYAGENVTVKSHDRDDYELVGLQKDSATTLVKPGESLKEINQNYTLTAEWEKKFNLNGEIRLVTTDDSTTAPETVELSLRLVGLPGTGECGHNDADSMELIEGVEAKTVTLTRVENEENPDEIVYTGNYDFTGLLADWHYGVKVMNKKTNYKASYTYVHMENGKLLSDQKFNVLFEYDPTYIQLNFNVDASGIDTAVRPKAVNVRVMQFDGSKWVPYATLTDGGAVSTAIQVSLNEEGEGIGTQNVQAYRDEVDTTPFLYRVEVVSYLMPDGTTVKPKEDVSFYTDVIDINGDSSDPNAGAYYDEGKGEQVGTITAKITAKPYTVKYVTNQSDLTYDDAVNVVAIPKSLPEPTKDGYVFLGWYSDETFKNPVTPGAYITKDMAKNGVVTLYAKWSEPENIKGSVYISWMQGDRIIPTDQRPEGTTVLLLRKLKDSSDDWNAVTSKDITWKTTTDRFAKSENQAFSFENIPSTNENGNPYIFKVVVNQTNGKAKYNTEAFTDTTADNVGTEESAAGSYHVKLTFAPPLHILPYWVDASALSEKVRPDKLAAKFVLRFEHIPAEDGDFTKWTVVDQHKDSGLKISLNDKGIGGADDDKNALVWVYQQNGDPNRFQMKLVNEDDSLFNPEGYSVVYSPSVAYDRNTNRWIGGENYKLSTAGNKTKAATVTLVPNSYPVSFNLQYDAYPDTENPELWQDSGLTEYVYGVGADKLPTPTRKHHTFGGWYENPDCTGEQVTKIPYNSTTAKTFYAKWTRTSNDATLTYDANGGENPPAAVTVTVPIGGSVKQDLVKDTNGMTPPSYGTGDGNILFLGWTENATDTIFEANDTPPDTIDSITMTDDTVVYAAWGYDRNGNGTPDIQEKRCTVTYRDGVDGKVFADKTFQVLAGSTTPEFGTDPQRSGYTFKGWEPAVEETVTKDVVYTAQWKSNGGGTVIDTHYTLTYESNKGTSYPDERYSKNTVVDLDKVPSREGYTFTGWYADKELTSPIKEIKMTSNKTVYAGWRQSTVPDMLNGSDHFAYVVGYPNGNVEPTGNISRAEVATIFFRLLKADVRDANLTKANSFSDVSEGAWFNTPVSTMEHLGIIKGRTPELFAPTAEITRAEFAAICARFDTSVENGNSNFTDISGHWAEADIQRAATLGWIQGLPDGTFQPDRYITRAEAMTMINRVLCRIPEKKSDLLSGMRVWSDNQPAAWYYLAVQEATNSHAFKHKGEIYEHWLTLTEDPNWSKYE